MTDKEIRVHVRNGLIEEPSLRALEIRELENGEWRLTRGAPEKTLGVLDIEVTDGVVTLNGRVSFLAQIYDLLVCRKTANACPATPNPQPSNGQ